MSTEFAIDVPADLLTQLDEQYAATPARVRGADTDPGKYQAQFKGATVKTIQSSDETKPPFVKVTLAFQKIGPPEALDENPLGNTMEFEFLFGTEVGRAIFRERMIEMGIKQAGFRETIAALATLVDTFWDIKVTHTPSKKDEGRVFQNLYVQRQIAS